MGKKIRVTPEELGVASKKLMEISESYKGIYNQLFIQIGNMGEAWQGEDNLAFVNRINGFLEELKQMADKVQVAGETMEQQRANYVQRQDDNIVNVNKLSN